MKIEHIICIVVIILTMTSCGSYRKIHKEDVEVEREAVRHELTEMSGIVVERWSAWMSEELSMTATEVHYSEPDSSGEQHITKTVTRRMEAKRDTQGVGEAVDSTNVRTVEDEHTDEDIDMSFEEGKKANNVSFVVYIILFAAIALAVFKKVLH